MFSNPQKNLLQTGIAPGAVVADFSAGLGHYTLEVASLVGNHGEVFAIDIRDDLLKLLAKEAKEKKLKNIHFISGNISKVGGSGIKDNSIDLVIIANTFFTIKNKAHTTEEIKRVLKDKGRILFIEWSDSFAGIGPHRDHVFPKQKALAFFQSHNFALVREIEAGDHHYGFIFRKK